MRRKKDGRTQRSSHTHFWQIFLHDLAFANGLREVYIAMMMMICDNSERTTCYETTVLGASSKTTADFGLLAALKDEEKLCGHEDEQSARRYS